MTISVAQDNAKATPPTTYHIQTSLISHYFSIPGAAVEKLVRIDRCGSRTARDAHPSASERNRKEKKLGNGAESVKSAEPKTYLAASELCADTCFQAPFSLMNVSVDRTVRATCSPCRIES